MFDLVDGLVKHFLGFPIVADHDGEMGVETVLGEPAEAFFSKLVLVAFVEPSEGFITTGFQADEDKAKIGFGQKFDCFLIKILKSGIETEITSFFVQSPIDDALGEFAGVFSPIPDAGVVEDFFDVVFVD